MAGKRSKNSAGSQAQVLLERAHFLKGRLNKGWEYMQSEAYLAMRRAGGEKANTAMRHEDEWIKVLREYESVADKLIAMGIRYA